MPLASALRRAIARTPAAHLGKMAALALVLLAGASYIGDRYRIGHDPQDHRSLASALFVIDRYDRAIGRGDYAAFHAGDLHERIRPGRLFIKRVTGLPGDRVRIEDGRVFVQGEPRGSVRPGARAFKQPVEAFHRNGTVPRGAYWMSGARADSFDSRYFGAVPADHIVGQAYPIH